MKKMIVFWFSMFSMFLFSFSYTISVPIGPTSLPAFYLEKNSDIDIETIIHKDRNVLISYLMQGKADMALMPTNEAVKLYNKGIDIKILNIHTWGVFYMITTNPQINSWEDLSGKEVYVPEKGGPMDILFNYITNSKNIESIVIKRGNPYQITQMMINDLAETCLLRETFVTQVLLNNSKAKVFEDVQKTWKEITKIDLPQASFVIRADILEANPDLAEKINSEYSKAIKWMYENIEEAAVLGKEKMNIPEKVTINSLERLNLRLVPSWEAKESIDEYLDIFYQFDKETIGGKMPDENVFYQRK